MQPLVDIFTKLNITQKIIALFGLILIIAAIYYYVGYSPLQDQMKKLVKQQEDLDNKLTENQAIAKNLDKFREELAILDEELKQAISLLPNDKDIRSLLRQITILQKKTNITNLLFKPGAESPKGFYAEIPIQLRLEGTYHDIALFFDKVGKLDRIVNINDIELSAPRLEDGKVTLGVTCTATTFQFIGGAGMPSRSAPADGGGAGGRG